MTTKEESLRSSWKHPNELIKLHRLNQKKKQLAARLNNNKSKSNADDKDKTHILEVKIAEKRKNPFVKFVDNAKKIKMDDVSLYEDDSLLHFVRTTSTNVIPKENVFVLEKPNNPIPANLVLQPFDPKAFSQMLQHGNAKDEDDDDMALRKQKFTKHLPIDWSLKTRLRIFCRNELPTTKLKTSQKASGLTSFVRCIDTQNSNGSLDISPATRLNQATYYWQHPYLPWLTLFPRNSKDNNGTTMNERERKTLAEDWDYSFQGLFQLLRSRQCPYFYLCANSFTVLFRAAGTGSCVEIHALMTPSTRGMRNALRQEGIDYTMPLKKDAGMNKYDDFSFTEEINMTSSIEETWINEGNINSNKSPTGEDDEQGEDEWLESLGVDEKEIRKIKTTHARKLKAQEMSDDFSDSSLLLIEGVECQGFYSFLLNAKSTISSVGRLAGVPPTLLAPVAFPKATMQHLLTHSNKVRMDGVDYNSIEMKGIILPTCLPYVCQLLCETNKTFSATLASSNNTLAFSKATQKLLEDPKQTTQGRGNDEIAEQVFGQENLSDCGLVSSVIKDLCRTGQNAVSLLEHICYDQEHGYAWS